MNIAEFPVLENKEEAGSRMWPGVTFDCALPQPWVDHFDARGMDVRPHFVWAYEGSLLGYPLPVTIQGYRWIYSGDVR